MFRVYGPHRFLRVHYDDSLPKVIFVLQAMQQTISKDPSL
jgi:hypothetical protein